MTIESSIKCGTATVNFSPHPIHADSILEGNPVARIELLSSSADGSASTYIWDCTAGRFNWDYHFDETLHVLDGSATLKNVGGSPRLVVAGDTIFFPKGSHAEWTVHQYIRKVAFCRAPLPRSILALRSVVRWFKRLAYAGAKNDDAPAML